MGGVALPGASLGPTQSEYERSSGNDLVTGRAAGGAPEVPSGEVSPPDQFWAHPIATLPAPNSDWGRREENNMDLDMDALGAAVQAVTPLMSPLAMLLGALVTIKVAKGDFRQVRRGRHSA